MGKKKKREKGMEMRGETVLIKNKVGRGVGEIISQ